MKTGPLSGAAVADSGAARRRPASPGLPRIAAVVVASVAVTALAGWMLDSAPLRSVFPGLVAMNPATATAFLLAAASLWVASDERSHPHLQATGRALAVAVALIGLAKLGAYLAGSDVGPDRLLFPDRLDAAGGVANRMAPNTAFCFVCTGLALALIDVEDRRGRRPAELLILPAALVALLAIIGYAYRSRTAYGVGPYIPMALNTAVAFVVLCLGMLSARPDGGWMRVVTGPGSAGATARRLLPAIIVIPMVLGWLRLEGERAGLYDTSFGVALMVIANVVALGLVIWWNLRLIHRAEAALRDSESRLFQTLEALPVAVFVMDGSGRPRYANRLSREILGKGIVPEASAAELPEVYGAYLTGTDTPYPPDRQPIARALLGEAAHATDMEVRRPDRPVPLEVWAAPVRDAEGRIVDAIAAFSDITERRAMEAKEWELTQRLQQTVSELEAVNQELEAFSYSVSHDLRAPLRHMSGFAQLLKKRYMGALDETGQRYIRTIEDAAQRMAMLIDDLLAFSRVGRKELVPADVDLEDLVRGVWTELQPERQDRYVALTVQPLPRVRGDPALLRLALVNLLSNALKYTRPRQHAEIEMRGERGEEGLAVVSVRDNGVGFDPRHADKLFGVFQRLHPTGEFEGTGIGLANVRRIVHRHGGRVWAESAVDQGATFYLTLPAAAAKEHA